MACVYLYKGTMYKTKEALEKAMATDTSAPPTYELLQSQVDENTFIPVPVYLAQQYEGSTAKARSVVEAMLYRQSQVLKTNPTSYEIAHTENNGKKTKLHMKRVSQVKKEDPYYKWQDQDNEDKYEDNREWGTQLDFIFSKLLAYGITNKTQVRDEFLVQYAGDKSLLSNEAIDNAINLASDFITKYGKNGIIMSQVPIWNVEKAVMGYMDVVVIDKDGKITVYDLKTSLRKTSNPVYGKPFALKDGTKAASKRESHSFSMSMYKSLLTSQGYNVGDIIILPWNISVQDRTVTGIKQENTIVLDTLQEVMDKYGYDATAEPAMLYRYKSDFGKLTKALRVSIKKKEALAATLAEKNALKQLYDELAASHDSVESINNLIDDMFIILSGGIKKFPSGKVYNYKSLRSKFEEAELSNDPKEALDKILEFKQLHSYYAPVIEEIRKLYLTIFKQEAGSVAVVQDGTPMFKLEVIGKEIAILEGMIKEKINPLYAKILWNNHVGDTTSDKSNHQQKIKQLERRIINAKDPKEKAKREAELKELKESILTTAADLEAVLDGATYEDINLIDMGLGAASMSGSQLVSLFALHIKNSIEKGRQDLIQVSREATKIIQETGGTSSNPAKDNEGMYTTVNAFTGKSKEGDPQFEERLAYRNPYDWNKWNNALKKAYEDANKMFPNYKTDANDRKGKWDFINNWYALNTSSPKGYKIDGVSIIESADDIRADIEKQFELGAMNEYNRDYILERIFDENGNVRVDTREGRNHRVPSEAYRDKLYETLPVAKKKRLDWILKQHMENLRQMGTYDLSSSSFFLNNVPKESTDQFFSYMKENGVAKGLLDTSKRWAKERFTIDKDRDYTHHEQHKTIPQMYSKRIPNSDISLDLISSVLIYKKAASTYQILKEQQRFSETYVDIIDGIPMVSRNIKGEIFTSAATLKEIRGQSNTSKILREWIDRIIYGETGDTDNPQMKKMASALTSFIAFTGLGGPMGLIANTANALQANAMVFVESFGRQVFSEKAWAKARLKAASYMAKDAARDQIAPTPVSLLGQLFVIYDAIQGEFMNEMGHKISQSALKKHATVNKWFFANNLAEMDSQYLGAIALLEDTKVKLKDGSEIPLIDAYVLNEAGNAEFRADLDMESLGKTEGLVSLAAKNKLAYTNKNMHGIYSMMDQPSVKKKWWGTLLTFYRNWFLPGIKRRYKRYGYNEEFGDSDEGMYRTFLRVLFKEHANMWKAGFGFAEGSDLTSGEKANLRKSSVELLLNILAFIMVRLLYNLAQGASDDDDRYRLMQAVVLTNRVKMELNQFMDPVDMFKLASTPTMALNTILNVVRLSKSVLGDAEGIGAYYFGDEEAGIQRYQRDAGLWDKGDSKTAAKLFRVLNYTSSRAIWTPDEAYKAQQLREL